MTEMLHTPSFHRVPSIALLPFVLITFGITWGITGLYILFPDRATAWLGQISGTHPAFIVATWGVWHLPAFFLAGTLQSEWGFLPLFLGNIALAILVTPLLNDSRGSILLPLLFHWQLINPFWPDARPWDTWILLALAVIVVWLKRETMLSGAAAVTEVAPRTADNAGP
jgi:hypothetical protein